MILSWTAAFILVAIVAWWTARRPLWGLYAVMLSVPFTYKTGLKGNPLYFLTDLTLLPFAGTVLWTHRSRAREWLRSPFMMFAPFLAFILLSAAWAPHLPSVLKEFIRWGDFVLLGLTASLILHQKPGFDKPIDFLSWIGVGVAVAGIVQFLEGVNQNIYRPGAAAFFGHPNPTAAFLSLCVLPALGLLVQAGRSQLVKRTFVFLILLLGLAFTFSRGVLLACGISGLFFLLDAIRLRLLQGRRAAVLFTVVLVTLGSLSLFPRFRRIATDRVLVQSSLNGRQAIFAFGWSVFKQHPWLGLGAGNLKYVAQKNNLHVTPVELFEPNYGDLHNLYLQLAAEIGAVGLFLFLGGILGFSFLIFRQKRQADLEPASEPLYRSLGAGSLAFLLANCSGFYAVKGIHLEWAVLLALQAAMLLKFPLGLGANGESSPITMNSLLRWYRKSELAFYHPNLVLRKIRQYYLRITSSSVQSALIQAYQDAGSPAHAQMSQMARIHYGLEVVSPHKLREAADFKQRLFFAREQLYRKGIRRDLGVRGIGFKDLQIQCASDSVLESMIYSDSFYDELTVLKVYESLLRPDDCVVDVGANIGVHTLAMSRIVGEKGKVFAYEPNRAMVARMQRNFELNGVNNIEVRETALGNMEGEMRFYDAAGEFNQGLGHQDPKGELTVPVTSLDKDLKTGKRRIALIKIDVEGMELSVVRSAREILKRDHPAIVVEFNSPPWRLKELIAAIPFATRIYRIPDTLRETMRPIESQSDLVGFNNLLILPVEAAEKLAIDNAAPHEPLWQAGFEPFPVWMRTSIHKFSQKVVGEGGLRILSTLFVLLLARTVGAEDFGRYSTAMAYAAFCAVIVDLGTNSILIREIARHPDKRQAIASVSHLLKLVACGAAWAMLGLITYLMGFGPEERRLTLCLGIVVIGYTLTEYFSALISGLEEMGWEAVLKIMSRALALSFAFLAIAKHQSLLQIAHWLAWGTLISYAASVVLVRQRFHSFSLAFNKQLLKSILASALPIFGSVIFWVLYDSQDILILNYFHFLPRDIGHFSAAMKVTEVFRVYPILVLGVFFPMLSKLHVSDPEAFHHKRKLLSAFMFVSLTLLATAVYASSPVIIRVLYKSDFLPAAQYLRLLTPALVLIGLNYTQVQILIANNREQVLLRGALLACVANLILAVILLPRFGVPGSCYAQLGSELVYFLILRRAAKQL